MTKKKSVSWRKKTLNKTALKKKAKKKGTKKMEQKREVQGNVAPLQQTPAMNPNAVNQRMSQGYQGEDAKKLMKEDADAKEQAREDAKPQNQKEPAKASGPTGEEILASAKPDQPEQSDEQKAANQDADKKAAAEESRRSSDNPDKGKAGHPDAHDPELKKGSTVGGQDGLAHSPSQPGKHVAGESDEAKVKTDSKKSHR